MQPDTCLGPDTELAQWTILRYLVLGGIVVCRVLAKMRNKMNPGSSSSAMGMQFFTAGWEFVTSEGLGLLIYFSVSAVMDNFTIFLVHGDSYCGYVKMVALYSMALVTFLPNCGFAYKCQPWMYDNGGAAYKVMFVLLTVLITVLSFIVRLTLVYKLGYANVIKNLLEDKPAKVAIAVLTPPIVDGLQSGLLIVSSNLAAKFSGKDAATRRMQGQFGNERNANNVDSGEKGQLLKEERKPQRAFGLCGLGCTKEAPAPANTGQLRPPRPVP